MNFQIVEKRKHYYSNLSVQFGLLRVMKDREVVFMDRFDNWKCIRVLMIRNIQAIERFFNEFHFFEKDYNIYVSLAKYKNMPYFTTDLKERSKETLEWFKEKAKNEIYDYDIFLDFDCKNDNLFKLKQEVGNIVSFLDKNNICFSVYPSGTNYQIVIKNFNIIKLEEIKKFYDLLKEAGNLKYLDYKGCGVSEKIRKCQYSLVGETVVYPIHTTKHFIEFPYSYFDTTNILKIEKSFHENYFNDFGDEISKKHLQLLLKKFLFYEKNEV